jgi:GTP cyclohydrolase II
MEAAQSMIEREGRGLIIWLDQEGKGNGHLALVASLEFKSEHGQAKAYEMAGYKADARSYRAAAEILNELKIKSIVLLANNPEKAEDLRRESIVVSGSRELDLPKTAYEKQ